ncbi:hypothetical protein PVAND_010472 [Polypedilum vanderplanki]|uniref:Uncharacterized protein n=1 Tax=Polypedilum vanderplanki TaxID=319348 RepID=A0A9J6CGU2_POLVA|nr:hypothetical protein PVAND_010472 [Polypedilum vanderplanki]
MGASQMSNIGDIKQHVRWQIPRASLSSGSRSFHSSTDSIQKTFEQNKNKRRESYSIGHRRKIPVIEEGPYSMPSHSFSSASSSSSTYHGNYSSSSLPLKQQQRPHKKFSRKQLTKNLDEITVEAEPVHGSSSQGSSSNSLHSASSLLLSVQNLEKFTRMAGNGSINKAHMILNMTSSDEDEMKQQDFHHNHNNKAKEHDQLSIASSNHFTLINGCGRANLKSQNSFCRHGRQITILIVTMTTIFTIGILGILYFMDRRAKSMPAYHQ